MTETTVRLGVMAWLGLFGTTWCLGDQAELIEAGKAALKDLKSLAPGAKRMSYFDIRQGPDDSLGYVIASLEATRGKKGPVYLYATETGITFPNGTRAQMFVTAKLRTDFEPIELELRRTMINREGDRQDVLLRAAIGPDKVSLSAEQDGQKGSREAPRPHRPFIYGIETLVQLLDHDKHKHFILREFDIQSGGAGALTVATETWGDGSPTVVTRSLSGEPSYQFWFDDDGKLLRWAEPSMPVMFVRTRKERAEWLKARFIKALAGAAGKPEP